MANPADSRERQMDNDDFSLAAVVAEYNGPKLRIAVAGGGGFVCALLAVPGASRVLDRIMAPYSTDAGTQFLTDHGAIVPDAPAVSLDMTRVMHQANKVGGYGYRVVTATAALTTNKYRRGDNHAYVAIDDDNVWHLVLDKIPEDEHTEEKANLKRYVQDKIISVVILSLATGVRSTLVDELMEGGYLLPCDG